MKISVWVFNLCFIGVLLGPQSVAFAVDERTGYLVATKELTEIGWIGNYGPPSISIPTIDLTTLSVRPDYVVAEADAMLNTPNSCVGLNITFQGYEQRTLTGTAASGDSEGGIDCFEGNIAKGKRTYRTASVVKDLASWETSLDISLSYFFGGTNASGSSLYVRKLRLFLYSYTPPDAANLPMLIDYNAFRLLVASPTIGTLFNNQYYVDIDNERYKFSADSTGSTPLQVLPYPLLGRQLSFYLPENSVYQSLLRYQQTNPNDQKLVVYGVRYNGLSASPAAYGNPISLRAFDLQRIEGLNAYLIPYPKPTVLAARPQATSVISGTNLAVDVTLSGIHPGTLKYKVGAGTEVSPATGSNPTWNDLLYKGKTTLAVPITGTTGKSVPVLIRANAIDSNQELSYSFVVTVR